MFLKIITRISLGLCILSLLYMMFDHYATNVLFSAMMPYESVDSVVLPDILILPSIPFSPAFYIGSLLCLLSRIRLHGKVKMSSFTALIVGIASLFSFMHETGMIISVDTSYRVLVDIPGGWLVLYATMIPQWIYHILFLVIGFDLLRELRNRAPRKEG